MIRKFLKDIGLTHWAYILFPLMWFVYSAAVILKFYILAISLDTLSNNTVIMDIWMKRIAIIVACFIIEYVFNVIEPVLESWYIEKKVKNLRTKLGKKLNKLLYEDIERMEKGDILSRVSVDVEKVQYFLENIIPTFGVISCLGISGFIICLVINYKFIVAFVLSVPVVIALGMLSGFSLRGHIDEWKEIAGRVNGLGLDILKKFNTVKIFLLESVMEKEFEDKVLLELEKENNIVIRKANNSFLKALCLTIPTMVMMIAGAWLVWNKEISAGKFTLMMAMSAKVANFSGSVQWFFYELEGFEGSVKRIQELLSYEEDEDECNVIDNINEKSLYSVEFQNVSFDYMKNEECASEMVLEDINLKIRKGERVAIVGPNGCGKSTLLNLITGLYTEKSGEIFIEGIKKSSNNVQIVRDKISCLTQNDYLFHLSVKDNIACDNYELNENDIKSAAQKAYIDEFVNSLPNGYNTVIEEDGKNISQGQKQRTCLARTIIKDNPILLLDEPTANLDLESESLIKKTIDNLNSDITVIAVSHSKSFIENFDYIYCMKDGRIVEQGTVEELVRNGGEFCRLFDVKKEGGVLV